VVTPAVFSTTVGDVCLRGAPRFAVPLLLLLAFFTEAVSVLALLHSVVALALVIFACPLVPRFVLALPLVAFALPCRLGYLALSLVTFALLFLDAWVLATTVSSSALAITSFASP
jgi:hypothetical protein